MSAGRGYDPQIMNFASQRYSSPCFRALRPSVRRLRVPVRVVPGRLGTLLAGLALSACTFSPPSLDPGPGPGPGPDASEAVDSAMPPVDAADADGAPPPVDAARPRPRDVVHVPEEGWFGGDAVVWNEDVTIDTTAGTLTGPGTEGLTLDVREHDPAGSQIAILHVGDLTVGSAATVRVVGNLPFVVISSGDIQLDGRIDAGGRGQTPGAGGAGPGQGQDQGEGESGSHDNDGPDSGGGGAGHATDGARGSHSCIDPVGSPPDCGAPNLPSGGDAGEPYGNPEVTTLTGGSGGGAGGSGGAGSTPGCAAGPGGAGGGAVQLYALDTITVADTGGIQAGGGGGGGGNGLAPSEDCAPSAGGGGGSGGVIYLQADVIELAGTLAANGGGGGAGATQGNNPRDGSDGRLDATPAPGGVGLGGDSSSGGAGGAGATAPAQGVDNEANGGGGGGAVGRIVLHCTDFGGDGLVSPAPHRTATCAP
jgi:hypothetical protein